MDKIPPLTISPVLREAAELKVEELNRAKDAFKRRYHLDARRSTEPNTIARVKSLIENVSKLNPDKVDEDDLAIMRRYVDQATDDQSVSDSKLLKFEELICSKLRKHLNRMDISTLHIKLMEEVMNANGPRDDLTAKLAGVDLEDDFEVVETGLDEVLEKFEKETFTADEVDVVAIEDYLSSLFADQKDKQDLNDIRVALREYSEDGEADGVDIDQDFLMWCIVDLLKSDSIDNDGKKTLQGYLQSPIALRELVSMINMKSIRNWEYKDADKGLAVKAQQNPEGQHCIVVEENIIDMLFLHSMGYTWAMRLKNSLSDFARRCNCFNTEELSMEEANKREYFLGRNPSKPVPAAVTPSICTVCHPYYPPAPMPPPPPMPMPMSIPMNIGPPPPPIIVIGKKKKSTFRPWMSAVPPPPSRGSLASTRNNFYKKDFFMSRLPTEDGCTPNVAQSEEVQANLMKTLAAESKLREAFDGLVYAGSAKLESLASSLPHKTVLTVLKFLGVPEMSLDFFERFLCTKLNIGPAVRGAADRVLPRARGVPEGHALELFFTEAVMFFLEVVVRQKTGSFLYRLKNDCYFVGTYDQHEEYEAQVAEFADVLGLEASFKQTQAIGFLDFTRPVTTIDDSKVEAYARRVKKQLSSCNTILDWVRVWNNTIGTYAAHLFGPLADIFGAPHLNAVRSAYKRIFEIVLDGRDLTNHVKNLLVARSMCPFPEMSSLEAFIYLPQPYGGLGVKNPFITLKLAHELREKPDELITKYIEAEDAYYMRAAENWALLPADAHARKIEAIYQNNEERITASLGAARELGIFMTKDELTEHRERASYPVLPIPPPPPSVYTFTQAPSLTNLYTELLNEPNDDILCSDKVDDEVRHLSGKGDMRSWNKLSGEDKWVLQLYGDECFERYGGLEMWVREYVPQEVLKAVRGAEWDDNDNDDESSYMSEC
ncbi:hypothetical protein CC86DRAFT_367355 [Ophiobolus disseminans]|uniref:Uncharacterized protein n=1 Tax=Ophiobolus disseminans TaxID=1469910 RepID=A0A6A7ACN5_9PLEO|nr:hypothetical protein CC86DRAFT_367355 [Ophiobolus disseminans]